MHLPDFSQLPRFVPPPGENPPASAFVFVTVLVAALPIFVLILPHPVVLPLFSLWALIAAACTVLLAILSPRARRPSAVAAWDMAGAFTLVGCAAAILGEIEPIIELIRPSGPRNRAND